MSVRTCLTQEKGKYLNKKWHWRVISAASSSIFSKLHFVLRKLDELLHCQCSCKNSLPKNIAYHTTSSVFVAANPALGVYGSISLILNSQEISGQCIKSSKPNLYKTLLASTKRMIHIHAKADFFFQIEWMHLYSSMQLTNYN